MKSPTTIPALNWDHAPAGWNWLAQDADGKWYWYGQAPQLGVGGGIWRANSRLQQFAAQTAAPNSWPDTVYERPHLPFLTTESNTDA